MADSKISDLAQAAALTGVEVTPLVQGGANVKATVQQIITAATGATGTNGETVTTSKPRVDLTQTWNNVATTFTGVKFNVTDTASAAGSLLMDLQVGGVSKAQVTKSGAFRTANNGEGFTVNVSGQPAVGIGRNSIIGGLSLYASGVSDSASAAITGAGFLLPNTSYFGWTAAGLTQPVDLFLFRDAANTLAQRNGVNAQTLRVYNTFTDASNLERGFFRWSSNVLEIGAEALGTGTQRQLSFPLGTVSENTPLNITQTWNASGTAFTGFRLNVTDTASAAASLLMDLQVGGASRFSVLKNGAASFGGVGKIQIAPGEIGNALTLQSNAGSNFRMLNAGQNAWVGLSALWLGIDPSNALRWGSFGGEVFDLSLFRDAANTLAQRNGVNAQTFRLYNTFTDSSNYERGFMRWNSNVLEIGAEGAGTGTQRALSIVGSRLSVKISPTYTFSYSYFDNRLVCDMPGIRGINHRVFQSNNSTFGTVAFNNSNSLKTFQNWYNEWVWFSTATFAIRAASYSFGVIVAGDPAGSVSGSDTNFSADPITVTYGAPNAGATAEKILGHNVVVSAGAGASASSGAANGGNVTIRGGTGYGTGRNGLIVMDNLPTANPLVAGALWNNAGVLSISAG